MDRVQQSAEICFAYRRLSELDTNPLAQYDSERLRVQEQVRTSQARWTNHSSERAVPTEFLAEDNDLEIEPGFEEPSVVRGRDRTSRGWLDSP